MSDDEKKFRLDELPDEGSSFISTPKPLKKNKKEIPDPRLVNLKDKDPVQRVDTMLQKWHFDERERDYSWVVYVAVLGVLEFTPVYRQYLGELDLLNSSFFDVGGDIVRGFTIYLEAFIRHPIILVLLTPLFFRFSKSSDLFFEVTFDGISTIRRFIPAGSKELLHRVRIKWKEIERVQKVTVDKKEVLGLYSLEGHIGDIIWYIDLDKKRAFSMVLKGMINGKHPLRIFLENEKELK